MNKCNYSYTLIVRITRYPKIFLILLNFKYTKILLTRFQLFENFAIRKKITGPKVGG